MSGRRRRWVRRSLGAAIALALLALAVLVAANLLLSSEYLRRSINRHPEKLTVTWEEASMWVPGHIRLKGLEVRGQDRRLQWWVHLDKGEVVLDFPALGERIFHLHEVDGAGLVFYLRPRPGLQSAAEITQRYPPIPGLALSPREEPSARLPSAKRPWTIHLEGMELHDVRDLWIGPTRLRGRGRIGAQVRFQIRGELEMKRLQLVVDEGEVLSGQDTWVRDLDLHLAATVPAFRPQDYPRLRWTDLLVGRIALAGEVDDLGFVESLLGDSAQLGLAGAGRLDLDAIVDHGAVHPGSHVQISARELSVDVLGYRFDGRGTLRGEVARGEEAPPTSPGSGRLRVDLQSLEVTPDGGSPMEGPRLVVEAESSEVRLLEAPRDPRLTVTIPAFRIPELSTYGSLLPGGLGLEIVEGSAVLDARIELAAGSQEIEVDLEVDRFQALYQGRPVSGSFHLHLPPRGENLRGGIVDLSGLRLELDDVAAHALKGDEAPWHAELVLREGHLELAAQGEEGERRPRLEDGRLRLEGKISDLAFLNAYHSYGSWLGLAGAVDLDTEVHLSKGALAPGSWARVASRGLEARLQDFEAQGRGTVRGTLLGPPAPGVRFELGLDDLSALRRGEVQPFLSQGSLRLEVSGPRLSGAEVLDQLKAEVGVRGQLDLAQLNAYLPAPAGLALTHGPARLEGELRVEAGKASGGLTLKAPSLGLEADGRRLHGAMDLHLVLSDGDLETRRFKIGASTLTLSDLASGPGDGEDGGPWTARLELEEGEVEWSAAESQELSGPRKERLDFRLPPGALSARGELSDVGILNRYFSYGKWLRLRGSAHLHTQAKVADGALQPGSYARITSDRLSASVLEYLVHGKGEIYGRLLADGGEGKDGDGEAELELRLEEIDLHRQGEERPLLHSPGLTLRAVGRDLADVEGFQNLSVQAELAPAEVPDLAHLTRPLGTDAGIHIGGGRALLGGRLELAQGRASGEVELRAEDLVGEIGGVALATDATLHARLASDDPATRRFQLSGSKLRLDNTIVLGLARPQDLGWWAELDLSDTQVDLGERFAFEGVTEVALRDSRPLTALLGRKRKLVGWLGEHLAIKDLEGKVRISLGAGRLGLDDLEVSGRHLRILGDLHLEQGQDPAGLFYIRFWGLTTGIRLEGGKRHLRLFPREAWYERWRQAMPPFP